MTSTILGLPAVFSLPVELLREIFRFCVSTDVDDGGYDMSWVHSTHVCRRWRDVALSCPDLWSNVVFSRPDWTDVMLKRSRCAPLAFRVNIDDGVLYKRMLPYLFANLDRIRTLRIHGRRSRFQAFIEHLQEHPSVAPMLECIQFAIAGQTTRTMGVVIPEALFAGEPSLPRLRRVILSGCAFAWDSAHYNNLTQLFFNIPRLQHPTFIALVTMLSGSPRLEYLNIGPVDLTGVTKSLPFQISLPFLRDLVLRDKVRGCAYILASLSIPTTTHLDITLVGVEVQEKWRLTERRVNIYYLGFIFSALFARKLDESHSLTLKTASGLFEWELLGRRLGPIFSFRAQCKPTDDLFLVLDHIYDHFFLRMRHRDCRVWALHLDMVVLPTFQGKSPVQGLVGFWTHLYALPDVTDLFIGRDIPSLLFEYLLERTMCRIGIGRSVRYPAGSYGLLPSREDVLPKLHSIHLERLPLNGPSTRTGKTRLNDNIQRVNEFSAEVLRELRDRTLPSFAQLLRTFLWARKRSHISPITRLSLEGCNLLYDADLVHFRRFCDLEWDGKGKWAVDAEWNGFESIEQYSMYVYERFFTSFASRVEGSEDLDPPVFAYMRCNMYALK